MIDRLIEVSLKNRFVVILLTMFIVGAGIMFYRSLPTDAFPDISPVMVPVFTEAHGMAPEEVERFITIPIESALNGLPSVKELKSTSAFGMNVIYVYFEDHVDIYFARQLVAERLQSVQQDLPELHEAPALGPIATGLGEVFMYNLTLDDSADTEGKPPLAYLRETNDWLVKYQLLAVDGITDVLSMGGHVLQYRIDLDPYAMHAFDIGLEDVVGAVHRNNRNAGGQFLVLGSEEHLVRGIGLIDSLDALRHMRVATRNDIPVTLDQIGSVRYGKEIRRGVVTRNGETEVVSGIVLKLMGENTSTALRDLHEQIPTIRAALPSGVNFEPFYDQGLLVERATGTIKTAVSIGALLVLLTLLVFLGNLRSALIVAASLPLCAFVAFIGMGLSGMSSNLMSLGGIAVAIGMLADGSIVMVENIHRRLNDPTLRSRSRFAVIRDAAMEVGRPIVFSLSIVVIVFLPIFSLQGVENKMFTPMALTMIFAVVGSIFTALFVAPTLARLFLKRNTNSSERVVAIIHRLYRPVLQAAIRMKYVVVGVTVVAFGVSLFLLTRIGTEFVPVLEEGTLVVGVNLAPSSSLEKNVSTIIKLEQMLLEFDEVTETVSKIGRPEAGGHPHPVNYALIQVKLKPRKEWSGFRNKEALVEAMNKRLGVFPGIQLNFTQPIQHLFDDLITGVKSRLALKIYGPELTILEEKAGEIKNAIEDIEGLVDLSTEQSFGQPQLRIVADREACARYGVDVSDILSLVELAVGGEVIDQIYVNNRRFGVLVRLQEEYRDDPSKIERLLVTTEDKQRIPLSQVAKVVRKIGPLQINRESNQRRWIIQGNVRGRDMGSVIEDIQARISAKVDLPSGYYLQYGGQFENQQRAMKRLGVIVPLALILILVMLYLAFGSVKSATLVMLSVPLSLIGGVFGLYMTGEYLSVPAAIGFIALFGIAVQDSMVLVTCINGLCLSGVPVKKAVVQGAMMRVRPVLITTITTFLGLLPLLLSSGIGAEVQRPLAVVVISGLISSTVLTLLIKPILYEWLEKDDFPQEAAEVAGEKS